MGALDIRNRVDIIEVEKLHSRIYDFPGKGGVRYYDTMNCLSTQDPIPVDGVEKEELKPSNAAVAVA